MEHVTARVELLAVPVPPAHMGTMTFLQDAFLASVMAMVQHAVTSRLENAHVNQVSVENFVIDAYLVSIISLPRDAKVSYSPTLLWKVYLVQTMNFAFDKLPNVPNGFCSFLSSKFVAPTNF